MPGGRPGSGGRKLRPASQPNQLSGAEGGFLPPLVNGEDEARSVSAASSRRVTVLRECNWVMETPVPPTLTLGTINNVGEYLRELATSDANELMIELQDAVDEVRQLTKENSELQDTRDGMQAELTQSVARSDAMKAELQDSRMRADELQRALDLTSQKLNATAAGPVSPKGGKQPAALAEASQLSVRVKELETQLEETEASWKQMFESSMKDMESFADKVGFLEGQLEAGILEKERAVSAKKVFEAENQALLKELERHKKMHGQDQHKIEGLFTDLAEKNKEHEALIHSAEEERRSQVEAQSSLSEQLAEAKQQLELLQIENKTHKDRITSHESGQLVHEDTAGQLRQELDENKIAITDLEGTIALQKQELDAQTQLVNELTEVRAKLSTTLDETQKRLAVADKGNQDALSAQEARNVELHRQVEDLQAKMLEAAGTTRENHAGHKELSEKTAQLAKDLRESNDRCADLKHEVGYLLGQLAESKAKTINNDEIVPEGPSKPVWEAAAVQLPGDDSRADAIVRMKVIEWGTVGADAMCQTEGEFMDAEDIIAREKAEQDRMTWRGLGYIELERQLREKGTMSEAEIIEIVGYKLVEKGEYISMFKDAMAEEVRLREGAVSTEADIQHAMREMDPDVLILRQQEREHLAATKIQAHIRGLNCRKIHTFKPRTEQDELEEEMAAIKIQSLYRGRQTRMVEKGQKTVEVECQTDDVPIGVATDEVLQAAGVSAKEVKRAKRHLEKRLRETGTHSEMEIFRLLDYGAAHQLDLAMEAEPTPEELAKKKAEAKISKSDNIVVKNKQKVTQAKEAMKKAKKKKEKQAAEKALAEAEKNLADAEAHKALLHAQMLLAVAEPDLEAQRRDALDLDELEPEPEPPQVDCMERLRNLLETAGLADTACKEYLRKWEEDGIDDEVLDAWLTGVITSPVLKEEFGVQSVGDRYKILAALKVLPSGGVVPSAVPVKATDELSSTGANKLSSAAVLPEEKTIPPPVGMPPIGTPTKQRADTPPDGDGGGGGGGGSPAVVVRGDSPAMEDLKEFKGAFDNTKSKMAELLSSHFEDAIAEKNQLLVDLAAERDSKAALQTKFDFVQSNLAYAQDQTIQERTNLISARANIKELELLYEKTSEALATLKEESEKEAKRVEQQLKVTTEMMAAERLEKEQYKVLVDKIGKEIVNEKNQDKRLVEEFNRERSVWDKERASLTEKGEILAVEVERLRKDVEALQDSLDMKENFAKRVEAEKENMVVAMRDLNAQLTLKSKQLDDLLLDKENVTAELRDHTEQYRDRLLEQMDQIKSLKEMVEKKEALIAKMDTEHKTAEEHSRAVIEEKLASVDKLSQQLTTTEKEKEKVAKNCFEQMSKLNEKLHEIQELKAEREVALQREKKYEEKEQTVVFQLEQVSQERDQVAMQLEDLQVTVEAERQSYHEARAENEVYSEQIKRLEMAVFEANASKSDAVQKARAKKRALVSEKDNISQAYLQTTMRLAQSKESEQEAQRHAAESKQDRAHFEQMASELQDEVDALSKDVSKLKRKLKASQKAKFAAEEDMKLANQRAIEVEEVLAEKVRQLGDRIFANT